MKKMYFTLLMVSLLAVIHAYGQSSFPTDGAIWQTEEITIAGPVPFNYGMCGDTMINNVTYQKVYRLNLFENGEIHSETYIGATRAEEEKSWFVRPYQLEEVLLYDYSLEAGDTITVVDWLGHPVTLNVDSIGQVDIGGTLRKVIHFALLNEYYFGEDWIEGVGSNRGPIARGYLPAVDYEPELVCFTDGTDDYTNPETLVECTILGTLDYCNIANSTEEVAAAWKVQLAPNPSTGTFWIRASEVLFPKGQLNLYNGNGQLIYSQRVNEGAGTITVDGSEWPGGMYFIQFITEGKPLFSRKILLD